MFYDIFYDMVACQQSLILRNLLSSNVFCSPPTGRTNMDGDVHAPFFFFNSSYLFSIFQKYILKKIVTLNMVRKWEFFMIPLSIAFSNPKILGFLFLRKTRRWVSVYLGVVVLSVWYFEHALLQLKKCHQILPEKTNPLLHLFAEPHSLYSMSQSTTKIVSFHDNVWKYAHLQCRHAWSQIAT